MYVNIRGYIRERNIRRLMVEVGYRCWHRGWVAANDGNISCRLNDRVVLCTPTGVSKGMLSPAHICAVDPEGNRLSRGKWRPTSEIKMHLKILRERPDVRCVLHAHPPYATAHAVAGIPLDRCVLPEIVIGLGSIPLVPYGTPSTDELPDRLSPYVREHDAWLLANHGALTAGEDIYGAYHRMESVELYARILFIARGLGDVKQLGKKEVNTLLSLRGAFGIKERGNPPGIGLNPSR